MAGRHPFSELRDRMLKARSRKTAFEKIEEGLIEALAIARGMSKSVKNDDERQWEIAKKVMHRDQGMLKALAKGEWPPIVGALRQEVEKAVRTAVRIELDRGESGMTDKADELLDAAKALLPYLKASTDHIDELLTVREFSIEDTIKRGNERRKQYEVSPADRLRKDADEIEAKDAAIRRFRAAVKAYEGTS